MEDFISERKCDSVLKRVCKSNSVTLAPNFKVPEFAKLTAIKKALNSSGHDTATTKETVDSFKDLLLDTLKPRDIKPIYFEGMLSALEKTPTQNTTVKDRQP